MCVSVRACVRACMRACMCVCWGERGGGGERERESDRQTDRQIGRQTHCVIIKDSAVLQDWTRRQIIIYFPLITGSYLKTIDT